MHIYKAGASNHAGANPVLLPAQAWASGFIDGHTREAEFFISTCGSVAPQYPSVP